MSATALDGAPLSLSPKGPIENTDPLFSWEPLPGAVFYRINARNAANRTVFNQWFTAEEAQCSSGETLCQLRTGVNWTSDSFRWKVIAKDQSKSLSTWSDWLVFFPGQDDKPGPPDVPLPGAPDGVASTRQPEFSWLPVHDTSSYRLQVRDAANEIVLDRWRDAAPVGCSDGVSACAYRSPIALADGVYRWKLLSKNKLSGGRSPWSDYLEFEVPPAAVAGSGLDARPQNLSCSLAEAPSRKSNVAAVRVFPDLPLNDVVILLLSPGSSDWVAVGKDGRVFRFDATRQDTDSMQTVLDISDRVANDTGETGLLGMAFHPDFPAINKAYLFYTDLVEGEYESHLSEFQTYDDGLTLDPASERRLLNLVGHKNHHHKAGTVAFGPEGYLFLSLGDGGNPVESQDPFNFFGTLLRIDIDHGDPWSIPPDNPFADGRNGAPEVYAYGFRNPWRWSIDPATELIWLTDVGLSSWEEINLVEPGANYGWPILEGPDCLPGYGCETEGLTPPLFAYPHDASGGFVVVGGFVYHGSKLSGLKDTFVYADGTDRAWALHFDEEGEPDPELLIDGGLNGSTIRSMFEDEKGELYLVKGGLIYQLVPDENDPSEDAFPGILSETGCVEPASPTTMAEGLVPYNVNSAFWTDGAAKSRWMAIPDKKAIEINDHGGFVYPPGSVLVKEFRMFGKRVETRLFARHDDGNWAGYSYAWNENESEAFLVGPDGQQLEINGQPYTIPSRNECLACHAEAAGRVLGLRINQLNRGFEYPSTGRSANQLTTLEFTGLLKHLLPDTPENLEALTSLYDTSAPLDDRARSYLDSNCSSCHRPDGGGRGPADLRYQPLAQMNICDVEPQVSDLGIDDARLLAPGDPDRSIISVRMGSLGPEAMPPIGKNEVDIDATAVVDEFISSVLACPDNGSGRNSNHWYAD